MSVLAVLLALAATGVALAIDDGPRQAPCCNAAPIAGAKPEGALSRGRLRFALVLRLRERSLDAYLKRVNPSAVDRRGLTAQAFGARFGQSDAQLAHLRSLLRGLTITVAHVYPQRTAMLVSAGTANPSALRASTWKRIAPRISA